ncbi:VWA domain-containing protein [Bifidobacterium callimiconis]|uniref:vWA domain-containing protein n=1 Tax=Bifidobacterium callimiconis TaxID=2306973 RepID=UPI001BDD7386|nr:vWA domain-containing protein [Bifidobacterium callimiconis]MBT1177697.1 VWA domain-containing protein [Bifidobacterium callimiconis]
MPQRIARTAVAAKAVGERSFRSLIGALVALMMVAVCLIAQATIAPAALADDAQPGGSQNAAQNSTNRFNVVFATDGSGSLKSTDKDNLRYPAISRFVALLAQNGNKVGGDVFGENVPLKQNLTELNSVQSKQDFITKIKSVQGQDWTNIGAGLQTAVDMLDQQKDPNLPSVIVLLSDGNTDMPNDDAKQQSLATKAQAIENARKNGYKIYTVSLNANGKADSNELKQIASATGGEFREVTKASDLQDVYSLYYSLLFNANTDGSGDIVIPDSGTAEGTFDVAKVGVEEANILVSGNVTDYSFTDPSGKQMSRDTLAGTTFVGDSFTSVKITQPAAGQWKYSISGVPGDHVRIDIVRNTNVAATLKAGSKKNEIVTGDSVDFTAALDEAGKGVAAAKYDGFTGTLNITDAKGGKAETEKMTTSDKGFTAKHKFAKKGSYTVQAVISGEGYDLKTTTLQYEVGNSAPKPGATIEKTVKLWPFMNNSTKIDLKPGATDREDKTLTYKVKSTAFLPSDYELKGSDLTMKNYSLSEGSFAIQATDSEGASCTFNVHIKTVNIGLLTLIGIGAAIVIALLVIGIGTWLALNKRFMGDCYMREYDSSNFGYREEVKRTKGRGRLPFLAFNINTNGFNPGKCYFQASGKDYVTVVIKGGPAYVSGQLQKEPIRVDGYGSEVTITSDPEGTKGVTVRFTSLKHSGGGYQ